MSEKLEVAEKLLPVHRIPGVVAGLQRYNVGAVSVVYGRKIWATVRCTFPAGADDHLYLEGFYSPDGIHYDTSTLFSTFLPVSEGNTRQITQCFNCVPEYGHVKLMLYNADDTAIEDVEAWIGVSKWSPEATKEVGEKPLRRSAVE